MLYMAYMETPTKVSQYGINVGITVKIWDKYIPLLLYRKWVILFIPNFTATHAITYTNAYHIIYK